MEKEEYTKLLELFRKFKEEAKGKIREKKYLHTNIAILEAILDLVENFIENTAKENE